MAVETEETLITSMIIKIEEPVEVKDNGTFNIIEGKGRIIHFEDAEDNGMEMTLITVIETTGIEIPMVKVILTGVEDGIIIVEVKDTVIVTEGEDGIPISNITIQGINNNPKFQTQIIIVHHLWDISTDTQSHMSNIHTPNNNNINPKCCQLHLNKLQIFVSCVIVKAITITEKENKKLRDVQFEDFPLEQFSDAGRIANEGDPHLKAAADTVLYDLEKCAIQIDIDKHEYEN